jgi:hypothetical protein
MTLIRFPLKRRRRAPPKFDPIADIVGMMGPGRHLASEILAELTAYCALYGKKAPSSIQIGKRLSSIGAKVARDRVYDVPEVSPEVKPKSKSSKSRAA